MSPSARPIVLCSPDVEERPLRRGPTRFHLWEESYGRAVYAAGGLPWFAPYSADDGVLDALIGHAQAVVLTGGDFDIDPSLFDEEPHPSLGTLKPDRTAFERGLYRRAVDRKLPILGVCGGMQLICALEGGTLWQDIDSQLDPRPVHIEHQQAPPKAEPGHDVEVVAGTQFASIVGPEPLPVNSTHHQAIRTLGPDLIESARAPDGIVEAFEHTKQDFCLGVQWHPEAMPARRQAAIYRALVEAAFLR